MLKNKAGKLFKMTSEDLLAQGPPDQQLLAKRKKKAQKLIKTQKKQ